MRKSAGCSAKFKRRPAPFSSVKNQLHEHECIVHEADSFGNLRDKCRLLRYGIAKREFIVEIEYLTSN